MLYEPEYTNFENIEILTTTYFFRKELISFLKNYESKLQFFRDYNDIPSSSGKETYSLSMYLSEKGIKSDIYGFDYNPILVHLAKIGIYRYWSLEDLIEEENRISQIIIDKSKYIDTDYSKKLIKIKKEKIINKLHFNHGDITKDNLEKRDVTLCFNLLYYFCETEKNSKYYFDALENLINSSKKLLVLDHFSFYTGCMRKLVDAKNLTKNNIDIKLFNKPTQLEHKDNLVILKFEDF